MSSLIRACIVNHNTSEFAELALRTLAATHGPWLSSGRLRITIMDNHSSDDGLPKLIMACDQLGAEFTRSGWPAADTQVNSHGDVMRGFVAAQPAATHYLFADADSYVLENDTVGRMAAELDADTEAWAIQARFSWLEEHEGPGGSFDLWAGRTQQLRVGIDHALAVRSPDNTKYGAIPRSAWSPTRRRFAAWLTSWGSQRP